MQSRASTVVPNDCEIGSDAERLMLLSGPNASGKTVYLRTVALVVYLAHVGSFVPAEAAHVSRTDAILTRLHSKESAAVAQSAFMLDLAQMAHIFRHASARSLCGLVWLVPACVGWRAGLGRVALGEDAVGRQCDGCSSGPSGDEDGGGGGSGRANDARHEAIEARVRIGHVL